MTAQSRNAPPVEVKPLPLIRSGELFSRFTPEQRDDYFNTIALGQAGEVLPEHVFGTNGWQRRLAETGADPELTARMFAESWDSMDPAARRNLVVGNAISRFYTQGVADAFQDAVIRSLTEEASAVSDDPSAFAVLDDPVALSQKFQQRFMGAPEVEPELGPEPPEDFGGEA